MTVDLNTKILKQVEFYFGDANLPRDKFLRGLVEKDAGGWVPLDVVASFTRMKALTEDLHVIKAALAQASQVVELNEDKTCVRRPTPIPESKDVIPRSLYVKGFPTLVTLDQLQGFFAQHSQDVVAIRMRYHKPTKTFKGSVFVEFNTEEAAQAFLPMDLSYEGQKLIIKTKMNYLSEKCEELAGRKKKDNKSEYKSETLASRTTAEHYVKALELSTDAKVDFNKLKQVLESTFPVAYVDSEYENGALWIRFKEPVARSFIETFSSEKPLQVEDQCFTSFEVPSAEEYQAYCKVCQKAIDDKATHKKGNRNQRQRQFRSNNKRAAENDNEDDAEIDVKVTKVGSSEEDVADE